MTFVQGFFSFIVELTNVDRGIYERLRIKTPLHPQESLEHLSARMIAYAHSYQEGLRFTEGMFDNDQPAIWNKDVVGELLAWVEVGAAPVRRMLGALRHPARKPAQTQFRAYFYSCDQIAEFCDALRGSKTNWIAPVSFYWIDPQFLESLSPAIQSSNRWSITIVDDTLFMICNQRERSVSLTPLDMWTEFQRSIIAPREA